MPFRIAGGSADRRYRGHSRACDSSLHDRGIDLGVQEETEARHWQA